MGCHNCTSGATEAIGQTGELGDQFHIRQKILNDNGSFELELCRQ